MFARAIQRNLIPRNRATVDIPVIRQEVAALGMSYGYRHLSHAQVTPLHGVAFRNCGDATYVCVNVTALHQDSSARYVFEPSWINLQIVAGAATQDFITTSANEFLLALVPYTHGRIRFVAEATTPDEARLLGNDPGAPFLSWSDGQGIMRGP
ncbi:Transcriptional regulator [Roseovarius mucosus DSM 17069]|uniref:Transcriptional regulator n=1 Tax=Roseovarius mucosus DSM 17069 TaxID=1288298 RepID=A0A0A0HQ65_9RHOB|nr:UTRA domain-containing protein [Roseovarius mucosus]KGM89992.1 Transcriptional regulator [Roseovarius mucosus DSM 17069]